MRQVVKLLVLSLLLENVIECHKSNVGGRSEVFDSPAGARKNAQEEHHGLKSADFETAGM